MLHLLVVVHESLVNESRAVTQLKAYHPANGTGVNQTALSAAAVPQCY